MSVKVPYMEHMGTVVILYPESCWMKEPFVSFRFDVFLSMNFGGTYFIRKRSIFYRNMSFPWICLKVICYILPWWNTVKPPFWGNMFFLVPSIFFSEEFCLTAGGGILVRRIPIEGHLITPWKFNIAPENIQSHKESSLPTIIFQGLC